MKMYDFVDGPLSGKRMGYCGRVVRGMFAPNTHGYVAVDEYRLWRSKSVRGSFYVYEGKKSLLAFPNFGALK